MLFTRDGCDDCKLYDYHRKRCIHGKTNPKTHSQTISVKRLMGWDYICLANQWKQQAMKRQEVRS